MEDKMTINELRAMYNKNKADNQGYEQYLEQIIIKIAEVIKVCDNAHVRQ